MADEPLKGLTTEGEARIKRALEAVEAGPLNQPPDTSRKGVKYPSPFRLGKSAATISPGGSGDVDIWKGSTSTGPTGETVTGFDWLGGGVQNGETVHVHRNFATGENLVTVRPAGATPGSVAVVFSGTCQDIGTGAGNSCWTKDVVSGAAGYDTVTVKKDGDGANLVVRLPHVGAHSSSRAGPSPNLAPGNIISYVINADGVAVISSGYDASVIGAIQIWDDDLTDVPFGWKIHDVMVGRIPVGVDASQTGGGFLPDLSAFADVDGSWTKPLVTLIHAGGAPPGLGHDPDTGGVWDLGSGDDDIKDHNIANHSIGETSNFGFMRVVLFIIRFHE